MEDYAMLLEMIINEMSLIAADKVVDTKKLSQLIESAKQYVDRNNKGAFTRAYNDCRRYLKYKECYIKPLNQLGRYKIPTTRADVLKMQTRVLNAMNTMAKRYCNYVMSL